MGDYTDREAGFVPLTYHTKRLGLRRRPAAALHGHHPVFATAPAAARRSTAVSFIPGLHDVLLIFEKTA